MRESYLAIDIGASGGRHILGWIEDGVIKSKEIYRFENGMTKDGESLCWDVEKLFEEVKKGMKICHEMGEIPKSVGIDTWAVDYVLLDKNEKILGKTYGYRDKRTEGIEEKVYQKVSEIDLYMRTGIAKHSFNTIFQLMAAKEQEPELLEEAKDMLLIPDYLYYRLTGVKKTEYTNATTTGLVNAATKEWDFRIIDKLKLPKRIFKEIVMPGTRLGMLKEEVAAEVGYNTQVITVATHDTASAVLAVPYSGNGVYISSGTWSLMGVEMERPDCSKQARIKGFTNEGGYEGKYRYLKNIMGLWMIQSLRNETGKRYSFEQLCSMAKKEEKYEETIDVNDDRFLAPKSMIEEVKAYCREHEKKVPENDAQIAKLIYESLAKSYGETVEEIKENLGVNVKDIYVVGGGANAGYLNDLTAKYTNASVHIGPTEATAIGNLIAQIIGSGADLSVNEARKMIAY